MRSLLTTLVTTPERGDTTAQTLAQLARFDLRPLISLSTPTGENAKLEPIARTAFEAEGHEVITTGRPENGYGGRNNARAFRAAFLAAHERGTDLLFCEDDIDLADDFDWFLTEARGIEDAATWFYTHDFRRESEQARRYGAATWKRLTEAARLKRPFGPKGLYRMRDATKANSGQCFYLPWTVLDGLPLHELDKQSSPVDRWTQDRVVRSGFPALVALPHPVQHRVDRTGRTPPRHAEDRKRKTSMSFDLR